MLFLVTIGTFVLVRAVPGNPALLYAGGFADPTLLKSITHQLGLDKPWPVQYLDYLKELGRGSLGNSAYTGQPVRTDLLNRLPATLDLVIPATILAVLIAIPLGVLGAASHTRLPDHLSRIVTTVFVAMPDFYLGLVLIELLYVHWHIAPSPLGQLSPLIIPPHKITGSYELDALLEGRFSVFVAAFKQSILPVCTLAIAYSAPIARQTRAAMLDVLRENYIRTARAYGVPRFRILFRRGLRNALLPVVTMVGIVFVYLMGGDVLVEVVYNWPGIGQYSVSAIQNSDYTAVQGVILVIALLVSIAYLALDVIYALLDPRIRLS